MAQRKALQQARTYIKSRKNLDKAEQLMTGLLSDSTYRLNDRVWIALLDAVKMQYDQGNEKLYLKQKYDTASLFTTAKKLFDICEAFDSVEVIPDKKGKVNIKYREHHAQMLHTLRPNLFNGGAFFLRKLDFKKAYIFYDSYIDCARQPLFTAYNYAASDSLLPTAAYRALYAAYHLKQHDEVMKHQTLAEQDTAHLGNIIQYAAEMKMLKGDTAAYVDLLKRGCLETPDNPFFFPRLIDYYNSHAMADSAEVFINNALANDSNSTIVLLAKSSALLNEQRYDECIKVTSRLLALNDSMPEAQCNMGLAYYNQAVALDKSMRRNKNKRAMVNELYEKSRPYMERFRQLAPSQTDKWVPALYAIYLNLNKGKEFEEIDALRQKLMK